LVHNIFKYILFKRTISNLDLTEFDQEFYDKQMSDAKNLKRFLVPINFNNENNELNLKEKPVSIETPSQMDCLQNNITYDD
jgi:hypothetical protein